MKDSWRCCKLLNHVTFICEPPPPLPPPFAVNALEGFVLHPCEHPYDSENSHYVNTETLGMHKKNQTNEEEAFIWMSEGQKHLEC